MQTGQKFALADALQIQVAVVILASGNIFWVFAVSGTVGVSDLEDGSDRASVLAGYTLQADVVLAAIIRMSVTGERSRVRDLTGGWASESSGNFFVSALGYLIGPHADTRFAIVGESGGALVPGGLSVPAVPEDVAFGLIGEDAVQPFAVSGGDRIFQFRPLAALDVVDVIAVFGQEFRVARVEGQTVSAGLQLGDVVVALPVLIAGDVMWVEAEVVRAFEVFLS